MHSFTVFTRKTVNEFISLLPYRPFKNDMEYQSFVDAVNILAAATQQWHVEEKRDISMTELSEMLVEIEREIKVVEEREKREERRRESLERVKRLREVEWERVEQEDQVFCRVHGVYIEYNGSQITTCQDRVDGGRIVVSIRHRYISRCKMCGDAHVKLMRGLCKTCDLKLNRYSDE